MNKTRKAAAGILASFGLLASLGTMAAADNINPVDGAGAVKVGNALQYEDAAGPGAFACSARGTAVSGNATLQRTNGGDVFVAGDVLDLTGSAHLKTDVNKAAVTGITIAPKTVTVPAPWTDATGGDAESHPFTFSTTVASSVASGAYEAVLTLTKGSKSVDGVFDVNVTCTPPPSTNRAPSVDAGGPYSGSEGSAIALDGGSFTDTDGPVSPAATAAWTIDSDSVVPGSCALTNATSLTGASITCTDNGTATVRLTVTDGLNAAGFDAAEVTITNANPAVATPTVTQSGPCSVSVSATFTDAGIADTHPTASIAWGDSTTGSATTITEPAGSTAGTVVSGSHTYATSGEKLITVSVTDDDGGTGTSGTASFTPELSVGSFLAPINTGSGPRSVFKLGSTIPVKVLLKDCAGTTVSTASPEVHLAKVDNVPESSVNEAQVTEVPTNGKVMRWDGAQYMYNLSTKNSQFNGGAALTAGSYRLWVDGSGIYTGAPAYFDLK